MCLTWAGGSLDGSGDAVGAILCDGLNRQLVLTHGGLLHYGNSLQGGGCLGALDDPTGGTYRGDGRNRLYFDWGRGTQTQTPALVVETPHKCLNEVSAGLSQCSDTKQTPSVSDQICWGAPCLGYSKQRNVFSTCNASLTFINTTRLIMWVQTHVKA